MADPATRATLTDHPLDRAKALGHTLEPDPPHELAKARRMTCSGCGRAVLWSGDNPRGWGGALEGRCVPIVEGK